MASGFNIFAWKILWTEEPFGLQSKGLQTDMTEPNSTATTFLKTQHESKRQGCGDGKQ